MDLALVPIEALVNELKRRTPTLVLGMARGEEGDGDNLITINAEFAGFLHEQAGIVAYLQARIDMELREMAEQHRREQRDG